MVNRLLLCLLVLLPFSQLKAQLNTDRITAIGRNALYFEDYVLSIQYFNRVIALKPYLPEPYQLRAIAKLQLGDYHGAMTDIESAIRLNPFQPALYYVRGFIYRHDEQYALAEDDFTKALSLTPHNRTYLTLRADVRARQDNFSGAIEDIDFLLRQEPHSPSLLFERGVVCLQMRDTSAAEQAFSEAVIYDTQNPQKWSALGMIHLVQNKEQEAYSALSRAISLGSEWAGDYINRGIISYRRHDYRSAVLDYDKAVEMAPRDADVYYNRGMLRAELGDYNHALEDYDRAIALAPDRTDMHYQRGVTRMSLRQWADAVSDFDVLIERYPNFLPAYYLASQAETSMGHTKRAYEYRYRADEQEKNATAQAPNTGNAVARASMQSRDRRREFNSGTAQDGREAQNESDRYASNARGAIQNHDVDIVNQPSVYLSYYGKTEQMRATNYYHYAIEQLNRSGLLPSPIRVVLREPTLTAELISSHFDAISTLTQQIDALVAERAAKRNAPRLSTLYLRRAIEFSLVKDYTSAMDDCTRSLNSLDLTDSPDNSVRALAAFMRANWRYRLLEYQRSTGELTAASPLDFEVMMRDYEYCIRQLPDFAFAYYNKANILCIQRDFDAAIRLYTEAIEVDASFAEAYFNRGLTRIYIVSNKSETTAEDEAMLRAGLDDLSRAGELGIYESYNLISRLR